MIVIEEAQKFSIDFDTVFQFIDMCFHPENIFEEEFAEKSKNVGDLEC